MAEQNPNARPDEQTPEQDALEKSLEELSLDELLASVKDDLARVDAMMDGPGDAAQPEEPDAPAPDTQDAGTYRLALDMLCYAAFCTLDSLVVSRTPLNVETCARNMRALFVTMRQTS